MSIAQTLLTEFEHEAQITRKFLQRVPENQLNWKCHEKSNSIGQLALHIAQVPMGVLGLGLKDPAPLPDFSKGWTQPKSVKEITDALDQSIEFVRSELPKVDDARMQQIWTGVVDGKPVMSMPRAAFLRFVMMNHWIQHRGQLGVYLRLLGAKVPSSYGPSGDEAA